jgi:hypothetical protein
MASCDFMQIRNLLQRIATVILEGRIGNPWPQQTRGFISKLRSGRSRKANPRAENALVLKGRIRGIYLRGEVYWFGKMVRGRRSVVSLETRDYAEAVQRPREILERPELQPAQAFAAEVQRFLKHKFETNRFSKASTETKAYVLNLFGDYVKNAPPANVTAHQCKSFYAAAKERVAASTAESYMFTVRSFFNWCGAQNLCRRNPALEVQLDRIDHKAERVLPILS